MSVLARNCFCAPWRRGSFLEGSAKDSLNAWMRNVVYDANPPNGEQVLARKFKDSTFDGLFPMGRINNEFADGYLADFPAGQGMQVKTHDSDHLLCVIHHDNEFQERLIEH